MSTHFQLTPIAAKVLQKMTSTRLYNHLKSYRAYKASFRCGCCHDFLWNIYPDSHEDGKVEGEYKVLNDYLQYVWDIINQRGDIKLLWSQSYAKEQQKIKRGITKGHQKISHSQRKKDRIRKKFD